MSKNVNIRPVESEEDLDAVFRFRYSIYVEEMQRFQKYANHQQRTIQEPLDERARILAAFDQEGNVVGTGRMNYSCETPDLGDYEELYGMRELVGGMHPAYTSMTTKFMVAPAYRHSTLSIRLASALYRMALSDGVLLDFIDCNPHLENYFLKLGYRPYKGRVQHPEYGDVLPMVLIFRDIAHLETVGSPFARVFRAFQSGSEETLSEKAAIVAHLVTLIRLRSSRKVFHHVG